MNHNYDNYCLAILAVISEDERIQEELEEQELLEKEKINLVKENTYKVCSSEKESPQDLLIINKEDLQF